MEKGNIVQYLIRNKGKVKTAHIWTGRDTACRMWSTGGLSHKKSYAVHGDTCGLNVCTMCENVHNKMTQEDPPELIRLVRDIGLSQSAAR